MLNDSLQKQNNQLLQQSLNKAMALHRIFQSEDYQQVLLPALKELSQLKPLNPQDFPNREDFSRKIEIMFARASAFEEFIKLLELAGVQMEQIRKKLAEPVRNYEQ